MKFFIKFFVCLVVFWCVSVSTVLACTSGATKCDDGSVYKCVCTRYSMSGSCLLYDWDFSYSCTYGYCKSSTSCASCKKNASSCSGGKRTYCVGGSWKTVTCTYGCNDTTCASCSESTNAGCASGKKCVDGTCYTIVNGACGPASGQTYSSAPNTGLLCSSGTYSWTDNIGSDGDYAWVCNGKYGGTDKVCTAFRTRINCSSSGYECVSSSSVCTGRGGSVVSGFTTCNDINQILTCCKYPSCSGDCMLTSECAARGGSPSTNYQCSMAGGVCCTGGGYDDECQTDSYCISTRGSCYRCDDVEINNTGYFYKKCQPHTFNGSCNNSIDGSSYCVGDMPSSGLCSYGSASSVSSNANSWTWTCNSSCGSDESCAATKRPTINGICGESNGGTFVGQPGGDLCTSGTVRWDGVSDDPNGDDGTYNWSCVGSCGGTTVACSSIDNIAPSLDNLTLMNVTGTEVGPQEGGGVAGDENYQGRNQICQTEFNQSRTIRFEVTATDPQGAGDIGDVLLRLRSDSGAVTTTGAVASVNGVANFTIDTSTIPDGTYHVDVQINGFGDTAHTAEWVYTGRDFRIWDCLVGVSGTFYDGSGQTVSCSSGSGYTNTIPAAATFSMAYYIGTSAPRTMNVTSPTFASGDKLYWSTPVAYQPVFTDFPGSDPTEMRINGSTCVSGISLDPKSYVDPYVDNPSMTVDYSSVLNQDSWFNVINGGVLSVGKVTNYVPVTCNTDSCKTSVNGVVWSKGKSTLSTYDRGSEQQKLNEKPLELKDTSYKYFLGNYFSKLGVGTTVNGSKNWSEISSLSGVIMVDGNLNINQNTDNNFRVVIVNGNIDISSNVSSVNAVLIGRTVTASGDSANQLKITGSVYTTGNVTFNRSFTDKSDNNDTPAVQVIYDPSIMFKMPKEVSKAVTQWRMN